MKCVILAGGSGDSLWPLSRRNFPKQFMNIKEGRSILQETVVRNMPFCEEFIIVTNESYKNIVNGQMKAFQSLKYRVILEGIPKGTGAAVLLGTMFANPSELVLVVNSDNLIDGDGYKEAVIAAKDYAKAGHLAVLGVKPKQESSSYGYILREHEDVKQFIARMDFDEDETEEFDEVDVPISSNILFICQEMPKLKIAAEICEDLWVPNPPSVGHAYHGANLIVNLSASDEVVGKDSYRKSLVSAQSARLLCGYIYATAGEGESTQDVVYGGHNLIAENGTILAESRRFVNGALYADLDIHRLENERRRMTTCRFAPDLAPEGQDVFLSLIHI